MHRPAALALENLGEIADADPRWGACDRFDRGLSGLGAGLVAQAVWRPSGCAAKGGSPARQPSSAQSQRGAKLHMPVTVPAAGTVPRIATSARTRRSAGGSDSSRPSV
jgi:hypothetical protein